MALERISTGITGLDEILSGGLIAHQASPVKVKLIKAESLVQTSLMDNEN